MDFFMPNQLARGRETVLLIDYSDLRKNAQSELVELGPSQSAECFSVVKKHWLSMGFQYIFMALHEKESLNEFVELFYEIVLQHYTQTTNDPLLRCIDICALYIFYLTQPKPLIPISVNAVVLDALLANIEMKSEENIQASSVKMDKSTQDLETTRDLLSKLVQQNAFQLSYLAGLKTRIVNKRGWVLKVMAEEASHAKIVNQVDDVLGLSDDALNLKRLKAKYLQEKQFLLRNFVQEDPTEQVDYDEDTGQIGKRFQEDLNRVTPSSLDLNRLFSVGAGPALPSLPRLKKQ